MKREEIPKYRLQILLDMRQKAKIDAEQSLLDAKAKLAEEQLQMDKLLKCKQDLLRLCLIQKEQDFKKISDIEYVSSDTRKADNSFDEIDNDLLILEEQILLQGQNVLLREHAVQEAKELFANKNTDFAALQKHKEKWLKEFEIGNDFDEDMNGVREEPAFIREMAAQGANWIDRLRASTEFLGLNITLDNLRHSKLESSSWKEKLKARMRQEEEGFREVQPQLAQILEEAKHEIQELQVKAVEEGRRAGYEQGILESMQLLAEARALRLKLIHEVESQSIKLAVKIAEKIVGYELDHNKEAIAQIVANAINFVNQQSESIVINLNQVDFENLKFVLAERWQNFADIELKANNNIRRGDCLIETEIGIIEVNLGAQLEQIMQILLGKIS